MTTRTPAPLTQAPAREPFARACAFAALLLILLNLLAYMLAPQWLPGHSESLDQLFELERRIATYPHRDRVRLLVLGNSHALMGLRPPMLAAAFELGPDEAFNLALPGASPLEMRMLAERHLADFPHAELAIVGVGEAFLTQVPALRLRYLSRGSLRDRWRFAHGQRTLDGRVGLLAGFFFPIADLAEPMRRALRGETTETLRAKRGLQPLPYPERELIAEMDYPWGHPIPFESPLLFHPLYDHHRFQSVREVLARTATLVQDPSEAAPALEDLGALEAMLRERGVMTVEVDMPLHHKLIAAIQARIPEREATVRQAIARHRERAHPLWVKRPAIAGDQEFYDGDHLSTLGARRMAEYLARNEVIRAALSKLKKSPPRPAGEG